MRRMNSQGSMTFTHLHITVPFRGEIDPHADEAGESHAQGHCCLEPSYFCKSGMSFTH